MPRMTRAKAHEVAEQLHIDGDAVLELPSESNNVDYRASRTPEPADRMPLGELLPNSGGNSAEEDQSTALRKSTRGQKGRKKGRRTDKSMKVKDDDVAAAAQSEIVGELSEIASDGKEVASSPANAEAAEDVMIPGNGGMYTQDATTQLPLGDGGDEEAGPSAAVRLTRSQLTSQAENADSLRPEVLVEEIVERFSEPTETVSATPRQQAETGDDQEVPAPQLDADAPTSPLASALPNVIQQLRGDTPGKRSTSNKENVEPGNSTPRRDNPLTTPRPMATYDASADAVVQGVAPSASTSEEASSSTMIQPEQLSPKTEDAITAMDALDEAVEVVTAQVPEVHASPSKTIPKAERPGKPQKAPPVVRTTKASQARISLAHGGDKSTHQAAARPSTTFARSSSLASPAATAGKRVKPSDGQGDNKAKRDTIIPHSKPRPVSLSFPIPPPPPKSRKAPTTSSFQLPGEAVAAKLKAAREERSKKEAAVAHKDEGEKKPAFKARPVPASLKAAPPTVRQTSTSRARESLMGGTKAPAPAEAGATKHKATPPTSMSTTASRPRPSVTRASLTASKRPAPPTAPTPARSQLTVAKRASIKPTTAASTTGATQPTKPRSSLLTATAPPSSTGAPPQRIPSKSTAGTAKGREVFNRAALAKATAEKERKEKEEAARKARAAAAERSRVASREWAEQRKKGKAKGVEGKKVEGVAVAVAEKAERDEAQKVEVGNGDGEGGGEEGGNAAMRREEAVVASGA